MNGSDGLEALLGKALAGELDPEERESLERALAADPALEDELARDARLGALLAIALEPEGRFERALRERNRADREETPFVDALRRRARPGRPMAAWMAGAAAAVFLGLVFWAVLRPVAPAPVLSQPTRPVSRTFREARDATIYGVRPNQAYGAQPRLEAGGHGLAALLRWDLSAVPPGSRVESASVVLGGARNFPPDGALRFYDVVRPWVEAQVTWREFSRGGHDRADIPVGTLAPADGHRAVGRLDVAVVQRWIDSPASNHGIRLAAEGARDWTAGFASREAPDPATRPALVLTWFPPERKK